MPTVGLKLAPFNLPQIQPSFAQYDTTFNQLGQMSQTQASASLAYGPHSSPIMSPFGAARLNQTPRDAAYLQWPSAAIMYAHSYDQFRNTAFQVHQC